MKPTFLTNLLICFSLLFTLPGLSAQEDESPTHGLGFSAGLTSGSGFTYRYLRDWGFQVSGLAFYMDQGTEGQAPSQVYILGTSLIKQLFMHRTKDKNFHAQLYTFWGATLSGGSASEPPGFGLTLSTGPGIGIELGIFRYLGIYTEVSQGVSFHLIKPERFFPVDTGVLFGTGLLYRY